MKIKNILVVTLAAFVFAACESEKGEQNDHARLEAQAKVSKADAQATALAKAPDGTVKECELEKEHGK